MLYLRNYLDTKYAKQKNNKEVFAMIDRIRVKKEAKGEVRTQYHHISDIAPTIMAAAGVERRSCWIRSGSAARWPHLEAAGHGRRDSR